MTRWGVDLLGILSSDGGLPGQDAVAEAGGVEAVPTGHLTDSPATPLAQQAARRALLFSMANSYFCGYYLCLWRRG